MRARSYNNDAVSRLHLVDRGIGDAVSRTCSEIYSGAGTLNDCSYLAGPRGARWSHACCTDTSKYRLRGCGNKTLRCDCVADLERTCVESGSHIQGNSCGTTVRQLHTEGANGEIDCDIAYSEREEVRLLSLGVRHCRSAYNYAVVQIP